MILRTLRQLIVRPVLFPEHQKVEERLRQIIRECRPDSAYGWYTEQLNASLTYQDIKQSSPEEKGTLMVEVADYIHKLEKRLSNTTQGHDNPGRLLYHTAMMLFQQMMRLSVSLQEEDFVRFFTIYLYHSNQYRYYHWPISHTCIQLEKYVQKNGMSSSLREALDVTIRQLEANEYARHWHSDIAKAKRRIEQLLTSSSERAVSPTPFRLSDKDAFGHYVNDTVAQLDGVVRASWYQLLALCAGASSGKPSQKFLKTSQALVSAIGEAPVRTIVCDCLAFLVTMEIPDWRQQHWYHYGASLFLNDQNLTVAKGLVWVLGHCEGADVSSTLTKLAERCYQKIPGVGPTAVALGNACFNALSRVPGVEGISGLSRLHLIIKQANARKLIQRYLDEAARRLGMSRYEAEEIAVPDFGLVEGKKTIMFDKYALVVTIEGIGKVRQQWYRPNGTPQKSVPTYVKQSPALQQKRKRVQAEVKELKKTLSAQRDRLDRSYVQDRRWTYEQFSRYYLHHGLMRWLTQRLIWTFHREGQSTDAIYGEQGWEDVEGRPFDGLNNEVTVTLWHPCQADTSTILAWRQRLMDTQCQQPIKQAHREVYLLTDAERNTRTYSNRMAAHLLKQHQFSALASVRQWQYSLMGCYDDGRDSSVARLNLPEHNLTASFWVNEIPDGESFNDVGIWLYVSTDQLQFTRQEEVIDLAEVPPIVLSEVMRDVDLFVGVASVGNDPQWQDNGGMPRFRTYWQSYSFGDLSEVAKTRKVVLENLLPRLKIHEKVRIEGRFLWVEGQRKTYKIHIGSTNILMEPDDRYLCIVPGGTNLTSNTSLFLPFEGDRGLSIILSKAMMLAEDDKITDRTILSQLA